MAAAQTKGRQTGASKLIVIAVIALLALGGAGGAWFFLMGGNGEADAELANDTRDRRPILYHEMSPSFIVNFPHRGRQRFLQAELAVMTRDEQALDALIEHMPVVRHNLNSLFSAQLIRIFDNPEGIDELRQMATEEVQRVLQNEIGRPGIDEVLFTTFVLH